MTDFQYEHLPHYLSLGAGVQSSTLALMYASGELSPMPAGAIFADTQAEPASFITIWIGWNRLCRFQFTASQMGA